MQVLFCCQPVMYVTCYFWRGRAITHTLLFNLSLSPLRLISVGVQPSFRVLSLSPAAAFLYLDSKMLAC